MLHAMLRAKPTGLLLAALVSILLHVAVLVPVVLRMGETATEPPDQAGPTEQGTIEFLPVEAQGSVPQPSPQEHQPDPVQAQAPSPAPPTEHQAEPVEPQREAEADTPSETQAEADTEPTEPARAEAESSPAPPPPSPPPTPPAQQASGLTMNLAGTDSETNAIVTGHNIIPASPDDRTRNRPPVYPIDAARRGQQGTVIVVISVSPLGLTAGTEIVQSSGHASLDQAVLDAVRTWRFRPAMRDGMAVPFDMPMQFVFSSK